MSDAAVTVDEAATTDLPATAPDETSVVSPLTRARRRPRSRRELYIWYLMRISGLALFVLALAHFSILHFIWDPAAQNAEFIRNQRWNQIFWRGFDWLLLMMVLFHGFMGVRMVIADYVHGLTLRAVLMSALFVTGALLLVIGTQVVLTLPTPAG
jgi:succinate dehydrogenase / fumarate reductase membrane anchor subunit